MAKSRELILTIFIWSLCKQNFLGPLYPFSPFFLKLHTLLVLFNYEWSEIQLKKEAVTLQKLSRKHKWENVHHVTLNLL